MGDEIVTTPVDEQAFSPRRGHGEVGSVAVGNGAKAGAAPTNGSRLGRKPLVELPRVDTSTVDANGARDLVGARRRPEALAAWFPVLVITAIQGMAVAVTVAVVSSSPAGWLFGLVVFVVLAAAVPRPLSASLGALEDVPDLLKRIGICSLALGPLAWLSGSRSSVAWLPPATLSGVFLARTIAYAIVRSARRRGAVHERALVVGTPEHCLDLIGLMDAHPECGLVPAGTMELPVGGNGLAQSVLETALDAELDVLGTRRVVVGYEPSHGASITALARVALRWGAHVSVAYPAGTPLAGLPAGTDHLWTAPLRSLVLLPRRPRLWFLKRPIDIALATVLLVLLMPVLLLAALAVRLVSRGPALFRQPRIGQHGRTILVFKFRTFPVDHADIEWTITNDECPLWVGRLLRRTSVDELPQLLNVLKGDMSLVGPRPERPHFAEPMSIEVPGYAERHRFPVGLTGLAQVNGLWGKTSIDDRVRFDNQYIDQWSLWRDVTIVFRTIPELIRKTLRG